MEFVITTIFNGASLAAVLILISLGLAIIFGLRGVINLAHGEFFMLGAYTVWLTESLGLPPFWTGFILAPIVVACIGWVIERSFIRFLYERPLETLLGTWGVSIVLRELIRILVGPEHRYATQPITGQLAMFGFEYPLYRLVIIAFTAVVVTLVILLFTRTDFGLRVQATIRDRGMAEAIGINTSRIDQSVFVLGAGLAGLAGAVMSPVIAINPNMGLDYFARTFLVVIIGGIGKILGVVGGGSLIGMSEAGFSAFLKPVVAQVIVLAMAILVIRIRPQGLFGKKSVSAAKEVAPETAIAQSRGSSARLSQLFFKNEKYDLGAKYVFFLVLLAIFPVLISSYQLDLLSKFLTFSMLALSLDLIWGYAGILSFAHSVFFGLGSYGLALTLKYWGHIPGATYIGLALAVGLPSFLALIIGYAMFFRRVGGVYFAIVTFALGGILHSVTIVWIRFTGGLNGLYGFPNPCLGIPGIWEAEISTGKVSTYYLIAAVLVLIYILAHRLMRSPFGQILRAINDDEERMESFGYNVPAVKLVTFVISCAIAGISGALYVPVGFVSADIMGILFSTSAIVWVAVGGRGTLFGAVLGALVVNYLQVYMSDVLVFYWYLIIGLFFVFVVLVWPDGIVGIFNRLAQRLNNRLKVRYELS